MLAVLPFENLTGDPEQEYISDGMTEELIAQLGGMDPSRLGVIARQSAMQFKKTTKRAAQIGSDLGVITCSREACGGPEAASALPCS